mgnify:CR=1 FL=1
MLESIFIIVFLLAFGFFILGIELKTMPYSWVSVLMFIVSLGGQVYIEVPTDTNYSEPFIAGICVGMIILNLMWILRERLTLPKIRK